jgi:hypothetical protein
MKNKAFGTIKANQFLLLISLLLLASCNKEDQSFNEFRTTLNGTFMEPGGECNRNIFNSDTVFVIHSNAMSSHSEMFYFYNIPEVKTVTTFYDQDIDFSLVAVTDQLPGTKTYRPVTGTLVIHPPSNNTIEGTFSMVVANTDTTMNDTVFIDKGYFKLSFSTFWLR